MDYIKFKGEQQPFSLGMAAISEVEAITGQNLFVDSLNLNTQFITAITFCGLKHGARRGKIAFKLSLEQVSDEMDNDAELVVASLKMYNKQVLKRGEDSEGEVKPLAVNQ